MDGISHGRVGATGKGAAEGWEGDRYALVELADGSRGLVWYVLWEDIASRDRFARAVGGVLSHFGGPATIQRLEAAGRPATVLRVGAVADVAVGVRIAEGS